MILGEFLFIEIGIGPQTSPRKINRNTTAEHCVDYPAVVAGGEIHSDTCKVAAAPHPFHCCKKVLHDDMEGRDFYSDRSISLGYRPVFCGQGFLDELCVLGTGPTVMTVAEEPLESIKGLHDGLSREFLLSVGPMVAIVPGWWG